METREKIRLNGNRDFSGNFDMAIKFIKQNFGPIARGLSYLIPLLLIAAFCIPNLFSMYYQMGAHGLNNPYEDFTVSSFLMAAIGYILLWLAMFAMILFTISYMSMYVKSDDGVVDNIQVWKKTAKVALPAFGASILFGLAFTIGFVLCIIPGIIVMVYLGFYLYAYINEDLGIMDSFQRSIELVRNNFWITLGYGLVFVIILSLISSVFAIPYYIGLIASTFQVKFFANDFFFILSIMILFVGSIFSYIIMYTAMGVMYYSHRNKIEGNDLEFEIDSIGNQNDTPPSIPY
ncbi:MAG: hypothetical protein LBT43_23705 [Prevotella sp.]|jgi:hypothetical protein|nr:hypothetical protein [Prevotella sp.]